MRHLDIHDRGIAEKKMAKILNEGRLGSHMHPYLEFMMKEDKYPLNH